MLYHYPACNHDRLRIGKFCSIACGAKFLFNAANHALGSLSTYPFPIFFEEWGLPTGTDAIARAWDNHGDIVVALIGDEATVKRLSRKNGEVWLMPENPAYSPIDGHEAQILGKVRAVIREYR